MHPADEALRQTSHSAAAKPTRGGLPPIEYAGAGPLNSCGNTRQKPRRAHSTGESPAFSAPPTGKMRNRSPKLDSS
jgi:hypothetical protein